MTTDMPYDRRLGERHPVQYLAVTLRSDEGDVHLDGVMTELSVSGVKVMAPASSAVEPGDVLVLGYEGHEGHVLVQRVTREQPPTPWTYGLELVTTEPELPNALYALLDDGRTPDLEAKWSGRYVD